MAEAHERLILLNRLLSSSITRAPQEHKAPVHGSLELLETIGVMHKKKYTVEFFDLSDDVDEENRLILGIGHSFVRLSDIKIEKSAFNYAILLFEFVDNAVRTFPVVNTKNYVGRELSGEELERGAVAAHVVIRMPGTDTYDDGNYRCAIEVVPSLGRRDIESFFSRQLRRYFKNSEFSVSVKNKKNSVYTKSYKYHPRLELVADVGRKVDLDGTGSRQLSHMIFVKRAEKKTIAQPTDVKQIQFYADVEQKISAKDGPSDLDEKKSWLESIRKYYGELGYETRLYYKSTSGSSLSGSVHGMIAEAADLLMCPKETIQLADKPSRWRKSISGEIASEMKSLLDKDSLWERAK